jgi:hypothetical protein
MVKRFCVDDPPTFREKENVLSRFDKLTRLASGPVVVKLVVPAIGTADALPAVNGSTDAATSSRADHFNERPHGLVSFFANTG